MSKMLVTKTQRMSLGCVRRRRTWWCLRIGTWNVFRRAEGECEGQTLDGRMEWWGMQRGWESEIERARPRIEMVGGDFLSRPRPCMGCSAWEWVSEWVSGRLLDVQLVDVVRHSDTVPDNVQQLHVQLPSTYEKTRGCQCSFRLLMLGGVSPETC
jgi:hypothetical protein